MPQADHVPPGCTGRLSLTDSWLRRESRRTAAGGGEESSASLEKEGLGMAPMGGGCAMASREGVPTALSHREPDRLTVDLGGTGVHAGVPRRTTSESTCGRKPRRLQPPSLPWAAREGCDKGTTDGKKQGRCSGAPAVLLQLLSAQEIMKKAEDHGYKGRAAQHRSGNGTSMELRDAKAAAPGHRHGKAQGGGKTSKGGGRRKVQL